MAITLADFNKIWSSTSPLSPYTFSDDDYNDGWNFIGQIPPSRQMWDFLQKNNDEKMQYLANNYLPLSGGTMTGTITSSAGTFVKKGSTSSFLVLDGGTSDSDGAALYLFGKDDSRQGMFWINANDGNTYKRLVGSADGTLTWGGQNVLTASNYNSYALPLSGGTLNGAAIFSTALSIKRNISNAFIAVSGGTGWNDGAILNLSGKDRNDGGIKGGFILTAQDGTNTKDFVGKPDGTLTWGNQPLLPVGVVQAFAGTTIPAGWLLCDGSAVSRITYAELYFVIGDTYGAGDGSTTFNLPNLTDKFIEGSTTAGSVKSAGLPNITGDAVVADPTVGSAMPGRDYTGAFSSIRTGNVYKLATDGVVSSEFGLAFDASKSNSIYGNSTTVQPPALTMKYIIKY